MQMEQEAGLSPGSLVVVERCWRLDVAEGGTSRPYDRKTVTSHLVRRCFAAIESQLKMCCFIFR